MKITKFHKKILKYFILLIILFITGYSIYCLYSFYKERNMREFFFSNTPNIPTNYHNWKYKLQPYEIDPDTTYRDSNNYNKIWRGKETSSGDLRVSDTPMELFSRILPFYNQMNHADIGYIQKYYKQIPLISFDKKIEKRINSYSKNAEIVNDDHFSHFNNRIWINRSNQYNPDEDIDFPFITSGIEDVDRIVINFMNQFNHEVFRKDFMPQNVHYSKYSIYKYRILQALHLPNPSLSSPMKKIVLYRILMILISNTSISAPIVYIQGYVDYKDDQKMRPEVKYYKIDTIGTYETSKLFLSEPGNELPEDKYQYMNIDYHQRQKIVPTTQRDIIKANDIIREKNFQFLLRKQYGCFNANPDLFDNLNAGEGALLTISNSLSNAGNPNSKTLCESPVDWYGQPKPFGVWDKPCKKDKECLFYNANQNYPNEYGKCNKETGYCDLPVNMLHLGYHYYVQNEKNKALCYNCNNREWEAISDLGECCEDQKDRKKYPFLKSPDYAFANDINLRINYQNQKKFLHL
jgi:hypothetical protein